MAIKFSQFITQTSASSLSHIVGYNGADNIQITPADFFTSFATGTTGFIPKWTSSSNLGDSILEVNSALPNDVLMPQYIRHAGDTNSYFGFHSNDTFIVATSNNEVMRVTSAGNVGIGTNAPVSKLDVIGGVTAQGTLVATGISQLGSSGANVYLTSSSAGSVGIGTSSPDAKLDVNGGLNSTHAIFSGQDGRGLKLSTENTLNNDDGVVYDAQTSSGKHLFKVSGAEKMRIDSAGNVGIGTTNPETLAHIKVNGGSAQLTLEREGGGAGKVVLAGAAEGFIVYDDAFATKMYVGTSGTYNGNVGIGTISPTDKLTVNGNLSIFGNKIYNGSASNSAGVSFPSSTTRIDGYSGITFHSSTTTIGSQTERMRITNAGNVGIGTSTPGSELDVSSSSTSIIRLSNSDTTLTEGQKTGSLEFYQSDTSGNGTGVTGRISMLSAKNGSNPNYYGNAADMIFQVAADPGFADDNATLNALTIKNGSGNVGIGTTSPGSLLSLQKDDSTVYDPTSDDGQRAIGPTILLNNNNTTTNTFGQIMYDTDTSGQGVARIVFLDAGSASSAIAFVTEQGNSVGERMRIDSSGNLVVGGTSAISNSKLNVFSNGSSDDVLRINADDARGASRYALHIADSDPNSRGSLRIATTSGASITTTNAVGIGTTSPERKLHIHQGDSTLNYIQITNDTTGEGGSDGVSFGITSNEVAIWNNRENTDSSISTNNTERIRITSAGNVGIGTTSPSQLLHLEKDDNPMILLTRNGSNRVLLGDTGSNNGGDLLLYDSSGSNTARIRSGSISYFNGGDVGIGTTSPFGAAANRTAFSVNGTNDVTLNIGTGDTQRGYMYSDGTQTRIATVGAIPLTLGANDTEKMRIDSSGDVGIGTLPHTAGNTWRTLYVGSSTTILSRQAASGTDTIFGNNSYINSSNVDKRITTGGASRMFMNQDVMRFQRATSGSTDTTISWSESMRIDSSGNVLFGTTGVPNGTSIYGAGFIPEADDRSTLFLSTSRTTPAALIIFFNPNGTAGSISTSGTSTSFNTSSDYRLKEDLKDFDGLDKVSKIPVYDFKWKVDDSRSYGVMAHELQEVVPNAVNGEKDAEEMQGVDYSKIVPLLIKSIQELKAEVEDLKSKI